MGRWIDQSKENLKEIIDQVKKKCRITATMRVAYCGYRDFGDIGDVDHFDMLDFTEDIEEVKEKIGKSRASGGGDEPEDVIGALE